MDATARVSTVRLAAEDPHALNWAVERLRRGELVVFPTDTVYGVAAHALLPEAVGRLYAAKERPAGMAIPLLVGDAAAMADLCVDVPALAWELAARFWPGPLSLVLRRSPAVPDIITAGGTTVALRVPDHPLVLDMCRGLGAPIAATSANRHGLPSPVTADEAWQAMAGRVALLLDGGPCPQGMASTVLDLTQSPPALLRAGPVTAEELAAVVGR